MGEKYKWGPSKEEWAKRRKKIGYKELWYLHFGGAHEGDKGCEREYGFLVEVTSGWRHAFESERSLRMEAEELLHEHAIGVPTERRDREWKEGLAARQSARKDEDSTN